jgi:hypothetical protein
MFLVQYRTVADVVYWKLATECDVRANAPSFLDLVCLPASSGVALSWRFT